MGGQKGTLSGLGNLRRSRGYGYEHTLVQRFNDASGWQARRLGGSSTGLPDIVAVNNGEGIMLTIEAKSGTGDILYVPQDQIERCMVVRDMFSIYPTRHIVFAFKFMSKKRFRRKSKVVYEQRKLVEYYKVADGLAGAGPPQAVKCTYDGRTFAMLGGKTVELALPDLPMPFRNGAGK
jgi:Holliday junction resolvase